MHYKNGRPAKDGDKVLYIANGSNLVGLLHSTNAQSTSCNGRVAAITGNDAYVTVGDCIHIDDVQAKPYEA